MYTAEQQAAHRKQWVDALRSGKYKQGTGRLRDGDMYCCLGIACDISGLGEWIEDWSKDGNNFDHAFSYFVDDVAMPGLLPNSVQDWLGVSTLTVSFDNDTNCLTKVNDVGWDFNMIADIIESGRIELSQ